MKEETFQYPSHAEAEEEEEAERRIERAAKAIQESTSVNNGSSPVSYSGALIDRLGAVRFMRHSRLDFLWFISA